MTYSSNFEYCEEKGIAHATDFYFYLGYTRHARFHTYIAWTDLAHTALILSWWNHFFLTAFAMCAAGFRSPQILIRDDKRFLTSPCKKGGKEEAGSLFLA